MAILLAGGRSEAVGIRQDDIRIERRDARGTASAAVADRGRKKKKKKKKVQNWFGEHMPTVKTKMISLSNTYQHDDPKTWEEIKANGDAAIVGVGHCSNCSPAVATHAITLETRYGVPTVALHTDKFDRVVQSVTKMAGMPDAPRAFVPQPVMGKTAAELKAYVYGKDPITGRPVMQEIIAGLITALNG